MTTETIANTLPHLRVAVPERAAAAQELKPQRRPAEDFLVAERPQIAICDYSITRRNPIGSCHLALIERLCEEIDFTVFAAEFDNPRPDRIRFFRVATPTRPLALLYLAYHVAVIPVFCWATMVRRLRFDLVQTTENYSLLGDIRYSQFCHRHYLKQHWSNSPGKGINRLSRWLDHRLRSFLEGRFYRSARAVVVPSRGLQREMRFEYSLPSEKFAVIGNPIDLERFAHPEDFDSSEIRGRFGFSDQDVVATFVALGHFERKGLPYIYEAMHKMKDPRFKLLVVGGQEGLLAKYRKDAAALGIGNAVAFAGMQNDVRPYLWASDLFLFPSLYETFSLVSFQAAAAGLPILVGRIHGVEEFLEDGENGIYVECSSTGVESGIRRFLDLSSAERARMGASAKASISRYSVDNFSKAWAHFYASMLPANKRTRMA